MDFGNCWNRGQVSAYLNDEKIATAGESTEATVEFAFHEGFVLKIVEHDTSIIQFNGFSVTECSGKYNKPCFSTNFNISSRFGAVVYGPSGL